MEQREPKTRAQIATEYGVSRRTLYNWLKEVDIRLPAGRYIFPGDQKRIYEALGRPPKRKKPPKRDRPG